MVTSILDIDLDYFNLLNDPVGVQSELLAWANRPIDVLVDNHAERGWCNSVDHILPKIY